MHVNYICMLLIQSASKSIPKHRLLRNLQNIFCIWFLSLLLLSFVFCWNISDSATMVPIDSPRPVSICILTDDVESSGKTSIIICDALLQKTNASTQLRTIWWATSRLMILAHKPIQVQAAVQLNTCLLAHNSPSVSICCKLQAFQRTIATSTANSGC